jgi:hypothetical protein
MKPLGLAAAVAALALAACGSDRAEPTLPDAGSDDDPLAVTDTPPPGSLDDLHQHILARRCSGQPGLCHNGQFEPNLSTPGMAFAYLVGRPGLEKPDRMRVRPGDPGQSLLIDKLRDRGVATRMPLGAEPLDESDLRALEAWIAGGALRAPGATPAPLLNNPPRRPEIAIFDAAGARLDGPTAIQAAVGTTLVLRHSVQDFETPDATIPFAAVILTIADGRNVVLDATATEPEKGRTTYDPAGPISRGDRLDYTRSWTITPTITVIDGFRRRADISAHGLVITVRAMYLDGGTPNLAAFDVGPTQIRIP